MRRLYSLNKICGNGLPHATEILGNCNDCRCLTTVVSILFISCLFPSGKSHQDSHHTLSKLLYWFVQLECRDSSCWPGSYCTQGGKQSPEVSCQSPRLAVLFPFLRSWALCTRRWQLRRLWTSCIWHRHGRSVLTTLSWLRKFRPSASVCM